MNYPPLIIAIDGYSSCGKSTLAIDLAQKLKFNYFDSGAMYRAVSLYFFQESIALDDKKRINEALAHIDVHFEIVKGYNHIFLNGIDVTEKVRDPKISDFVSEVAAIESVRTSLVQQQQVLGLKKRVVMDGRDIGTVVFPNAEVKLFITASIDVRTERRYKELKEKGLTTVTRKSTKENLIKRDRIDASRSVGPLIKALDALELDNTQLNHEEQLDLSMRIIFKYLTSNRLACEGN